MTDTREFCPECNQPKDHVGGGVFVCPRHPNAKPVEEPSREWPKKPRRRVPSS